MRCLVFEEKEYPCVIGRWWRIHPKKRITMLDILDLDSLWSITSQLDPSKLIQYLLRTIVQITHASIEHVEPE